MSFQREFEHREALVDAAVAEFADHGFDKASLTRILTRAGMSKGQFYHHFDGKESLYHALVEHFLAQKAAWFETRPLPEHPDFFTGLRDQLQQGLAYMRSNPQLDAFGRSFLRERGRPIFAAVLARHGFPDDGMLSRLVLRAHAAGAFAPGVTSDLVLRLVHVGLSQLPLLVDLDEPEHVQSEHVDELLGVLERGLQK